MAGVVVVQTAGGPVERRLEELPEDHLRAFAAMGNEDARAVLRARAKAGGLDRR